MNMRLLGDKCAMGLIFVVSDKEFCYVGYILLAVPGGFTCRIASETLGTGEGLLFFWNKHVNPENKLHSYQIPLRVVA